MRGREAKVNCCSQGMREGQLILEEAREGGAKQM